MLLLIALIIRMRCKEWTLQDLCKSWKIELPLHDVRNDWIHRSIVSRVMVVIVSVLLVAFLVTSFIFVTHFPSYADDAFGNWHLPVINIIYD